MKVTQTALMMAARGGQLEVVKALIEAGADVNLKAKVLVCCLGIAYLTESIIKSVCQFYLWSATSFYVHFGLYIAIQNPNFILFS